MDELVNSIRLNGILKPVIIRPAGDNHYEMLSGHRRMYAAEILGLEVVPAIIRELSDEEATIIMVDYIFCSYYPGVDLSSGDW